MDISDNLVDIHIWIRLQWKTLLIPSYAVNKRQNRRPGRDIGDSNQRSSTLVVWGSTYMAVTLRLNHHYYSTDTLHHLMLSHIASLCPPQTGKESEVETARKGRTRLKERDM